jgi:hypothetical protein
VHGDNSVKAGSSSSRNKDGFCDFYRWISFV